MRSKRKATKIFLEESNKLENFAWDSRLADGEEMKTHTLSLKQKIFKKIRSFDKNEQGNLSLYWDIGKIISEHQIDKKELSLTLEKLSQDVQKEYPGQRGFSNKNFMKMYSFYLFISSFPTLEQLAKQISWTHNLLIMSKCKNEQECEFYLRMTIKYGWIKTSLAYHIQNDTYQQILKIQEIDNTTDKQSSNRLWQDLWEDHLEEKDLPKGDEQFLIFTDIPRETWQIRKELLQKIDKGQTITKEEREKAGLIVCKSIFVAYKQVQIELLLISSEGPVGIHAERLNEKYIVIDLWLDL